MVDETMLLALVFSISSRPAAANLSSSRERTGPDLGRRGGDVNTRQEKASRVSMTTCTCDFTTITLKKKNLFRRRRNSRNKI